ncbi:dystroglycan 1-like [Lineus longissimus]|uniref:dystroglycan 1-like n=1 Tax=Lineus longissimus TaxID=88925 RepID=UPI002B4FB2A3
MTTATLCSPSRGCKRRSAHSITYSVLIVTVLLCDIMSVNSIEETNDIQSLLRDELPMATDASWNLPDTKATVGKLFQYNLGLKKQSGKYKIKEISRDSLPTWLTYDTLSDQLEGVPSTDDVGEHNIALVPEEPLSGMVKHFFTVVVKDDHSPQQLLYSPMTERTKVWENCRSDDPVTMTKIILDADMASLTGNDRAKVFNSIINHLSVSPDFLRLHPLGDEPAYDKSALVAGPGNTQDRQKPGVVLSWQIGCGSVDAENMAILEKVESSARDGSMAKIIGHPIVGWSVTNNRPQSVLLSRKRRAIQATAALEASPPTKVTGGQTDTEDYFGETEDGFSRNIPNMASPKQTKHHRTKTAGRHMHKKSRRPNGNKYKSPMATPSMTPIVPTAHIKVTSTMVGVEMQPSRSKIIYTTPSPEQAVSRTAILVQPSMPGERPLTTTSYTAPLPTPFLPTYTQFPSMPSTSEPTITSTSTEIKPSRSKEKTKPSKEPVSPEPEKNKTPFPNKRVFKRIDGNFGRMISIKIPPELFKDEEDGDTRNLKLMLLREHMSVPRSHWLQLKEKQQILQGVLLPQKSRGGKMPRKLEFNYELAAIDSGGKIARTPLQVVMKRLPHINKINHEFMISIDFDYNIFKDNVVNSLTVVNKIARLYGDNNADNIIITSLNPGSVLFSWTNTSVEMAPCPALEINQLLSYIITDKKTLTQSFVDIMRPYRIKTAGARALGACQGLIFKAIGKSADGDDGIVVVQNMDDKTPYVVSPETGQSEDGKSRETSEDNLLITTVVPAVVIAAMILLAAIIACVLYRKKHKGKLSHEDKHTFVNKGIPVIFADELEDKPDPPTKPLIMPEEKPPLPPPEYHRSGSIPPSPPSDHKDPIESTEDERDYDDRDNSPPYQPPPPFMSADHRQQRPRQVQMHRSPPPYVPP